MRRWIPAILFFIDYADHAGEDMKLICDGIFFLLCAIALVRPNVISVNITNGIDVPKKENIIEGTTV
jgi:hypothetical protein